MSKKIIKKSFKFIVDSALRSLAVFLILGMTVVAYAYVVDGISWPDQGPGKVTGVVGMFVGVSDDISAGSVGGYKLANNKCESSFSGSHICTATEIINTYNNNSSVFDGFTESFWINSGPPAYTVNAPNDCNGWKTESGSSFATAWNFTLNQGLASSCALPQKFTCCK